MNLSVLVATPIFFFFQPKELFIYWTISKSTITILTRSLFPATISFSLLPHEAWLCSVLILELIVQTHLLDNILNLL